MSKQLRTGCEYLEEELECIMEREGMNAAVDQARMNGEMFPRFVDAHVHLSDKEYAGCIDEIIQEARMANVVALVSNSVDMETSIKSLELAEKYAGLVYVAVGIQPASVEHLAEEELERTLNLISTQKTNKALVAIGEIGLDSNHMSSWNDQLRVFDEMLHCAERMRLPVIVHSRGTAELVIDRLLSYNLVRVLLHFFTGPADALSKAIENGYYVSEGPAAVYSEGIREVVRKVPITNLLTETDGPVRFYKPPFKGKRTTPAFIPEVVRAIAKIKETSAQSVAEKIAGNFEQFFTLKLSVPR
ncbi:MAG: TatD family hydrolase [Candidatus Bathyarchaeia archaeon]